MTYRVNQTPRKEERRAMYRVAAALVPLIWLSTARALDDPKDKAGSVKAAKADSVVDQIKDLQKEMQKARTDLQAKLRDAEKDEEKQEIRKEMLALPRTYAKKYLEIAEQNPKDPASAQALAMVLTTASSSQEANKAVKIIIDNQRYETPVVAALRFLARMGNPQAEKLLRGAAEHAATKDDRGIATLALAQFLKTKADRGGANAEKLTAEAEKLFETVVEKYADVKQFNRSIGAQAKGELFEMRHLSIGKTVPEITAEDIDGVNFKLSDYRGKVVLLDFWGNW
jgi:hypothetical protein